MPECNFGLNDKLSLQRDMQNVGDDKKQVNFKDMKFHRCVKLNKFSKIFQYNAANSSKRGWENLSLK